MKFKYFYMHLFYIVFITMFMIMIPVDAYTQESDDVFKDLNIPVLTDINDKIVPEI